MHEMNYVLFFSFGMDNTFTGCFLWLPCTIWCCWLLSGNYASGIRVIIRIIDSRTGQFIFSFCFQIFSDMLSV